MLGLCLKKEMTFKLYVLINFMTTIMYVEDEFTIRRGGASVLNGRGYLVKDYYGPFEAIQSIITGEEYDLLLTDLSFPRGRGDLSYDALDLIKASRERNPRIPIVIATGAASIRTDLIARGFEAIDVIQKPYTMEKLVGIIDGILNRHLERV